MGTFISQSQKIRFLFRGTKPVMKFIPKNKLPVGFILELIPKSLTEKVRPVIPAKVRQRTDPPWRTFAGMTVFRRKILGFVLVFITSLGPLPLGHADLSQTGVTQTLIALLDKQDRTRIDPEDYESTSLRQLITFATPAGYRLKLRYLEFGMSLVEALKVSRDEEIRKRLIEVAQWSRRPRVRAEAIITLAGFYNPEHKKYFKSAILDGKIGIRFAGIEALQTWNQKDTLSLLYMAMDRDWSPLMQIHAAQALLSLGQEEAIAILWKFFDHNSWVVRAMAARYLGDYGKPDDYQKLNRALIKETKNDYVVAELAVASLKLISQKDEKVSYSPASAKYRENQEVAFTIGKGGVVELEPLIIVPPSTSDSPFFADSLTN